jgi:hypothetical protein
MCIALRSDKASKANTKKSEGLAKDKSIDKSSSCSSISHNILEKKIIAAIAFCFRIQTRFKALGLTKTTHCCHRTTFSGSSSDRIIIV